MLVLYYYCVCSAVNTYHPHWYCIACNTCSNAYMAIIFILPFVCYLLFTLKACIYICTYVTSCCNKIIIKHIVNCMIVYSLCIYILNALHYSILIHYMQS